jgi:hypothetical protein
MLAGTIALWLSRYPAPAIAATCRKFQGQQICLERIQRSAKYHWQYRVTLRIDDVWQPLTLYDCRDLTIAPLAILHYS